MHLKERKQEIEMKRTIRIDINLVALSILLIIRGKNLYNILLISNTTLLK